MGWEQLTLSESFPEGYLPASNPDLVEGYISIEEIMAGDSGDFRHYRCCPTIWCEHALNEKRKDPSYKILVKHFRDGGSINIPILRYYHNTKDVFQSNGHHRIIAAMDAGFTHMPYQTDDSGYGWKTDWSDTPSYDEVEYEDSGE